jgi:hypothetical protein
MKVRKSAFALAASALFSPLPAAAQTAAVTMEAETMTRSSYAVEGNLIKLTASTGSASKAFNGPSGTYNVQVFVLPENDGTPRLEFYKGATRIHSYTYPVGSGTTVSSYTIDNVALTQGESIRLVGFANAGAWARVDKVVFTPVGSSTPPAAGYTGTPYSGTPVALPKAFKAVDFDKGGEGVAYHDLSAGNAGNLYRTAEGVDIVASADASGGGYAINNFQNGEWLNYSVNVPAAGNYDLAIRAANNGTTGRFHIEVDGVNVTGPISVPATGGWATFQWFGKQAVPLSAGKHVLKVVAEQQYFNMSAVSVLASAGSNPTPVPPATSSPLTIEAESMALSSYAVEGNLIKLTAASGNASKAFAGASGTYNMQVYMLPENDGTPTLELYKGATRIHSYTYPTGNGSTVSSYTINNVALTQGETLKLVGTANGGAWARVDKIVLTPSTGTTPTPTPTPTGGGTPTPTPSACANPSGGYEGFGRNTTGGAGKAVYRVTNLNDSGAGSLRDALSQGNRCVVFDVGGTITLGSDLLVKGANVTIDGFTAASPGITLKGRTLVMQGSSGAGNIVVRGIRHRSTPSGVDAMRVYGASNIVFDHVSVSGFGDGAIDVTEKARDVTIQWSILGNGLSSHNFSSLIKYNTARVSVHHNLYVNSDDRNPHCGGYDGAGSPMAEIVCDVRNNLIWNYRWYGTAVKTYALANVINNYYYTTYAPGAGNTIFLDTGGSAYVSGNYSKNGWNLNGNGNRSTPYSAVSPATTDALTAAQQVLQSAGARGAKFGLDSADQGWVKGITLQ